MQQLFNFFAAIFSQELKIQSRLQFSLLWQHPLPVPAQLLSRFLFLGQFILHRNTGVVWKQCAIKIFLKHKIFWTHSNSSYCFEEAKKRKGIDSCLFAWCMLWSQVTILNAEDIRDNYSTSHVIVTVQKWHCSSQLLWEYKAKHLYILIMTSYIALPALVVEVQHVKSCTQT